MKYESTVYIKYKSDDEYNSNLLKQKMTQSLEEFKDLMNDEAENIPCDSCAPNELMLEKPPWFDEKLFTRGRKYILENFTAQLIACLTGLISILSIPNSLNILIKTKKSSTKLSAYRRYVSTTLHMYAWLRSELSPGSESWNSLLTVRKRHLRASRRAQERGESGIAQKDLVVTLFGFFGYSILKAKNIGMVVDNEEDLKAYLHFWRTIGFMVGIHDKYNFCDGTPNEVKEKLQYIRDDICRPHLLNPPEYFYHMVKALLDGMFNITVIISTKPFLYLVYILNDIPGFRNIHHEPNEEKNKNFIDNKYCFEQSNNKIENLKNGNGFLKLSGVDEAIKYINNPFVLNGEVFLKSFSVPEMILLKSKLPLLETLLITRFVRWLLNAYFHFMMFLLQYFPYSIILQYGLKRAFVDIFSEDIAIPTTMKTNQEVLTELYKKNLI